MDGNAGEADLNEGVVGDALKRLVFGRAPVQSRLVKVRTAGVEDVPLASNTHYATLTLASVALSSARVFTSKFRPVFFAQAAFGQDLYRPIRLSALVADHQDSAVDGAPAKLTSDGMSIAERPLFGQTPYRGRLDAQFTLLACRSEAILKALLPLTEDIRKSVGAGGADHATGLAGTALRALMPGALAADVATAAAKAVTRLDGAWSPRMEVSGPIPDLASGHYAIVALRNESDILPALEYDPATRIVTADGKRLKGRDVAILRVDATTRRENIVDIPDLGPAFEAIDLVFASGGNLGPTLEKFRRIASTSPHLTDTDRKDLIDRVIRRTELLKAEAENPIDRNESVLSIFSKTRGLSDLGALWTAAPRVLEGMRQISASAAAKIQPAAEAAAAPETVAAPPPAEAKPAPAPPREGRTRFDQVLAFSLRWEGGMSDDPDDRGGRTNQGVTEKAYHAWLEEQGEPRRPIEKLQPQETRAIYRTNYWLSARCADLPDPIDLVQFDAAVNHGPGGAARLLQRAINRTLRAMTLKAELPEDGSVGPLTLKEARRVDPQQLAAAYLAERRALYQRIVESRPNQKKFLEGWLNRVADLERQLSGPANESLAQPAAPQSADNTAFAGFVE